MSTIGAVIVSRNDNYGGNLVERAIYSLNSAIETYDEVILVDYNSRDKTLFEEVESYLIMSGKLKVFKVTNEQHKQYIESFSGAQSCNEVLGRNIGIRRATADFIISTNIDEIQPPRRYIENFEHKDKMLTVARHGTTVDHIKSIGEYHEIDKIRDYLISHEYSQAWAVTREPWSLVEWPGDFQMAHKDLWYHIRGYDEWLLGAGIHDSHIHRKVKEMGGDVILSYDIPIYHLDHNKKNDYGENCVGNSNACLYGKYVGQLNSKDWGYPDDSFKEFRI